MSQASKRKINRSMQMVKTDDFYNHPYTVVERVSLNFFDPSVNSNKFYIAEVHQSNAGLGYRFFVNHGRVGANGAPKSEPQPSLQAALTKFQQKVHEKLRKGYVKVDLATVTAGSAQGANKINADALKGVIDTSKVQRSSNLPSAVAQFVKQIYEEANQAVSLSLTGSAKTDIATPLGNLGINGINKGREILNYLARAVRTTNMPMIERLSIEYYKIIPRKMPSDLRKDTSWVLNSHARISKEMDILDLYEDALRMLPVMGISDLDAKYMALNCDIIPVTDPETMAYISHKVTSTVAPNHNYKLRVLNAFQVNQKNAPPFNPRGIHNCRHFFHGSRSANIVGILSSYLKLPSDLGSDIIRTGAMFGPGIYFASESSKSFNYSMGTWAGRPNKYKSAFLFICEVAMGEVYKTTSPQYFTKPPVGYHSVMGCKGPHLLNHEFIVYDPQQVRIKYVVECEKY